MGAQEYSCKILQLSDCTMMYILSYLDATSLFNLSRTCSYFKNIVEDSKLWRYIDARHEPNSTKKVQYVCDRIHDKTSHIFLRAESKYNGLLHEDILFGWNHLEYLTVLALENQRFDGRSITLLKSFPRTLEELSLKKTYVKNGKLFFQGSFSVMKNLRVLILDECGWLDSNFFLSVAKYENLEILSVIKCMRLHLNIIPYLNVARYGCKKLKIIDCRFSTVGNEILVHPHSTFLALYFQSMRGYQMDTGRPLINFPPVTAECRDLISQNCIKDLSLIQYKHIIGDIIEELPQSILYEDPYPECSCGYKDEEQNDDGRHLFLRSVSSCELLLNNQVPSTPFDDYIDFDHSPVRFICRRHMKDLSKLPMDFKNFFYQNQKKFCPDSSDSDSDSDDDRDCCMFGMGSSQQMIVLKIKEVRSCRKVRVTKTANAMPEAEIIDIRPTYNVINVDLHLDQASPEPNQRNIEQQEPRPSTSRNRDCPETSANSLDNKRKSDGKTGGSDRKRPRFGEYSSASRANRSNQQHEPQPSTSRIDQHPGTSKSSIDNKSRGTDPKLARLEQNGGGSGAESAMNGSQQPANVAGPSHVRAEQRSPDAGHVRVVRQVRHFEHYMHVIDEINPKDPKEKAKLRRLSLRGYRGITDDGLNFIRNLNLDLLDVTYTSVTKEGVENFLTFNPNCRVLHPNYCVCKPRIPC